MLVRTVMIIFLALYQVIHGISEYCFHWPEVIREM
jgi:hypothetical protein